MQRRKIQVEQDVRECLKKVEDLDWPLLMRGKFG